MKTSFPQLRDDVREVLARVEALGVAWRNTRFDRYLGAIVTAAEQKYPRSVAWERDRERQRLFWEAASQTQQLINSSTFWNSQDKTIIRRKLQDIMKGHDLPPSGSEADRPRNTLLELTTAALLYRSHFEVQLSGDAEDVLATIAEQTPFAVECKRPAGARTLRKNLKELRAQLRVRCKHQGRQGLAVIAADRLLGLTTSMPMVKTTDELVSIIDRKTEQLADEITRMVQHRNCALFPMTRLAALVLVGTVFVSEAGMPVTLGRMTMFCTGAEDAHPGGLVDVVNRYLAKPPRVLGAATGPRGSARS